MTGTWTYAGTVAGALSAPLDLVRLQIGDTDPSAPLFTNEEINVYLANRGNAVLLTSADLCDAAATRFSRAYDFAVDGQSFSRGQMVKAYQEMARDLRNRASGLATVAETRVDGYSQTIDSEQVAGTDQVNPRQTFVVVHGIDRIP